MVIQWEGGAVALPVVPLNGRKGRGVEVVGEKGTDPGPPTSEKLYLRVGVKGDMVVKVVKEGGLVVEVLDPAAAAAAAVAVVFTPTQPRDGG